MESSGRKPAAKYAWRPWKVLLFVLAGVLVAAGGVLALGGKDDQATKPTPAAPDGTVVVWDPPNPPRAETFPAPPDGTGAVPGARSLFGSNPAGGPLPSTPAPAATPEPDESLSPAFLRGGISFFAAFALAFAFRIFLKLAMFFVGLWLASLFLLSSAGYLSVHWQAIDASFTNWAGSIGKQFESFRTFIQGSLPSAGMAGLGLLAGFRRR